MAFAMATTCAHTTDIQFGDFMLIQLPDSLVIQNGMKALSTSGGDGPYSTYLSQHFEYEGQTIYIDVYLLISDERELDSVVKEFRIEHHSERDASLGMGSIYEFIYEKPEDLINLTDGIVKYVTLWGSGASRDLLVYDFRNLEHPYVEGCFIQIRNAWPLELDPPQMGHSRENVNRLIESGSTAEIYSILDNAVASIVFL